METLTDPQISALIYLMLNDRVNPGNNYRAGCVRRYSQGTINVLIRKGYAKPMPYTDSETGAPRVAAVRP